MQKKMMIINQKIVFTTFQNPVNCIILNLYSTNWFTFEDFHKVIETGKMLTLFSILVNFGQPGMARWPGPARPARA